MKLIWQRLAMVAASVAVCTAAAWAAPTPEQKCQAARAKAAGAYAACQQNVQAKSQRSPSYNVEKWVSKCRVKYTGTWAKLQAKAALAGSLCTAARFVDNLNGTVTDNLTGLVWEKKTNDATVHDEHNVYTWSNTGTAADGTAFTVFLSSLNSGGCFAGQCDWRLPSRDELQTVLLEPYPCATSACIDAIFGWTQPNYYWSATSGPFPAGAWFVIFSTGFVGGGGNKTDGLYVRGVRGGL
jgi:hypothetical protein